MKFPKWLACAFATSALFLAVGYAAAPRFEDDFKGDVGVRWQVRTHGGCLGGVATTPASAQGLSLYCDSPLAGNVYLAATAAQRAHVKGGETLVLRARVSGDSVGRAFACVQFFPEGGQARLYLPMGTYENRMCARDIQVPENATQCAVSIGVESETKCLRVESVSLTPDGNARSHLAAAFLPRPYGTVYPKAPPPAKRLVVLDARALPDDEKLLVTTLQGIVNRARPRVYLLQNDWDGAWLDELVARGHIEGYDTLKDVRALLAAFRNEIKGVAVEDPDLAASRNGAVMLGALEGIPATTRACAERYRLPVLLDLKGRWQRALDMYREIWQTRRAEFASHIIAVVYPMLTSHSQRDYLVQHKIFHFWVSSESDNEHGAAPYDEWRFANDVLAQTPPNIPCMGWWSAEPARGVVKGVPEYDANLLCSSYAKFLAASDYSSNLSVLSGFRLPQSAFRRENRAPEKAPAADKLSVALTVFDSGDCPWYWQIHQRGLWSDSARGSVPINWNISPALGDLIPTVYEWYYRNATPNDAFVCAISGVGYMSVGVYGARFKPADRARIWAEYAAMTARLMRAYDLDVLEIYAGAWGDAQNHADVYARFFNANPNLEGILSDFGRHDATNAANAVQRVGDKRVYHTLMRWKQWSHSAELGDALSAEDASVRFTVEELLKNAPAARPARMSGLLLSWTMRPGLVKKVADALPKDVEIVPASALFAPPAKKP